MCAAAFEKTPAGAAKILPPLPAPSAGDEAHHRIANSLQLLSALIAREACEADNPVTHSALERMQARIAAIAGVHRHLHVGGGNAEIDLGRYLVDLTGYLAKNNPAHRRVLITADPVPANGATASTVGMLVTELVTNACKHAYAADAPGDIHVSLRRLRGRGYRLAVEDQGCGTHARAQGGGLGQRLIAAMVRQLDAIAAWEDAGPGTRFCLEVENCR